MNFHTFKFSETENNFYFYFISPFSGENIDLVSEQIEHYIANEPTQMNQYLNSIDFDAVKIEKVSINPIDVINKTLPSDDACMNTSDKYVSLIPPPKVKRTPKPKADKPPKEKKEPKPRSAKKGIQNVQISAEPVVMDMNK